MLDRTALPLRQAARAGRALPEVLGGLGDAVAAPCCVQTASTQAARSIHAAGTAGHGSASAGTYARGSTDPSRIRVRARGKPEMHGTRSGFLTANFWISRPRSDVV